MNTSLYLISPPRGNFFAQLPALFAAGIDVFQYRRKHLSDRAMLEEINYLQPLCADYDVELYINDRPDLALAANAAGVHLGDDDLPAVAVKKQWPNLKVGITVRAGSRPQPGLDYYSIGPVFEAKSKKLDIETCGWRGVEDMLTTLDGSAPLYCIGGLTADNIKNAPQGVAGFVVVSAVWKAKNPLAAVKKLQANFKSSDSSQ